MEPSARYDFSTPKHRVAQMLIQRIRVIRARRNVDASEIVTVRNPPKYLERGENPNIHRNVTMEIAKTTVRNIG